MRRRAAVAAPFVVNLLRTPCASARSRRGPGSPSGRVAFDGGLAERIGPHGQLLLTDPSDAQLRVAVTRAHQLGLDWVRFLQAPVERLPLAAGTVSLVLGSTLLHFTDPRVAIAAMARLVRPGGRVAVDAGLDVTWGSGWSFALAPAEAELRAQGLPFRTFFAPRSELEEAFGAAGVAIDRIEVVDSGRVDHPTPDVALGVCQQIALVRLWLKTLPDARVRAVERIAEDRIREGVHPPGLDWSGHMARIRVLGHRPA